MQRINLSLLVLFLGTLPLLGQETETRDLVVGLWQIDVNATIEAMEQAQRTAYDQNSEEQRAAISNSLASRQFQFMDNGNYKLIILNRNEYSGTWQIEGQTLSYSLSTGDTFQGQVVNVDPSHLTLKVVDDPASTELFHVIHLSLIER